MSLLRVFRLLFFWMMTVGLCAGPIRPVFAQAVALPAGVAPATKPATSNQPGNPGQPADKNASQPVTVITIEDQQYQGPEATFAEGKLTVKSDPPQTVAMDELQKATYVHPTKLALEWIGQDSRDIVQVGAVEEGNGIQDVHVRATGLTAKNLKQIVVVCKPLFRVWRLDVKQSPHWKIGVERIGQASTADFFFEPPAKDLFEQDLEITLSFDDNSIAKGTIKAAGHTSDQAKMSEESEQSTVPRRRMATVNLDGGDNLHAFLIGGEQDRVKLQTSWHPGLDVPLLQIRGILFEGGKPEVKTKFDERLAKTGDDDFVLVTSKDGGLAEISGRLQSFSETALKILYEGQERTIKLERIQAIVMAAHPTAHVWKGPYQVFHLASGDTLAANWLTQGETSYQVKTAWDSEIELTHQSVVEITGKNTKMVNLSELTPFAIEQVPYFDRLMPWVKDQSWNNRPLRLNGKNYHRGLAMHSRCVLTYDLGGEFSSFRALLGIDEEAGDRGRVNCKVSVDDQAAFSKIDLKAGEKPVPVEVSVKNARQLRLEVDFGEEEDVGDRAIWANARLYRE